ncbi:Translation initiation factor eIF-2B subunit epsilon [Trichoplax sp. H2]|uniref:Translation initiation factor eIF2B subunit epsilon n=1 Tax=Trichoplax adhaerens TaxID=10228 RepID=B3S5J5_TRIAD|nr:hypothetical protein TRIADDRAFT_64196 [Trichoplax adhaerens]EDV21926.1 hypothetical protein TRIADDRAFT_64196 [Trichoplax adhaerens]RDD41264.1 Translation initiation factor eIF-2B subunit epsilon [Trichoplax sp. H2]|eukprot:XP_002115563.1 hypothetical protein TRIADDRAFT_64196 [Trichoplax adhaerens]
MASTKAGHHGGGKGKKKAAGGDETWTTEDILQAVIIGDSFNFRFLPVTHEKPRTLLPLVNRPLLDYTIDFLLHAGVQDIFVYCCAHCDQITAHMQQKIRSLKHCCNIKTMKSDRALSLGDALRDIENQAVIKSDFILVSGDLVSNMKLQKALEEHKQRRKNDKMSVMTMILKESAPGHRSRCSEEDMIAAIDPKNNRLLHYQMTRNHTKVSFPASIFLENRGVHLRYDLLDCHVSICSPQVTQLFTDNFDYQTIYDFIRGILISEEITGHQIHTYTVTDEYAVRVSNLHMYDAVSKDVIHRWSYPLVPDEKHTSKEESYTISQPNIYLGAVNVILARSCVLSEDVVIGSHCSVGEGTQIKSSVIGNGCKIGNNVIIKDSYVWNNVIIDDDCCIINSLLCDDCRIKRKVNINSGCLLSFGVVIGPDVTLEENSRFSCQKPKPKHLMENDNTTGIGTEQNEEAEDIPNYDRAILGPEGIGYVWQPELFNDYMEDERGSLHSEDSDSDSAANGFEIDDEDQFHSEVSESIRQGFADKTPAENIIYELNGSKFAYNRTVADVAQSVVLAIMDGPSSSSAKADNNSYLSYYKEVFSYYKTLIENYAKTASCQIGCLEAIEDYCLENSTVFHLIQKILLMLYNLDIIEELPIQRWFTNLPPESDETLSQRKRLRELVQPFISWLNEAEEESSEDDE